MSRLSLILKGGAMGVAEVIPGVSGGTIAFISGIYERLLNAVKAFGPGLIGVHRREGLAGVWRAIDGGFPVASAGRHGDGHPGRVSSASPGCSSITRR
jgi:putative membrane protein